MDDVASELLEPVDGLPADLAPSPDHIGVSEVSPAPPHVLDEYLYIVLDAVDFLELGVDTAQPSAAERAGAFLDVVEGFHHENTEPQIMRFYGSACAGDPAAEDHHIGLLVP